MKQRRETIFMPTYTSRNKKSGKLTSHVCPWSEFEQYLKDHPEEVQEFKFPAMLDAMKIGVKKPDPQFRRKLNAIKRAHKGSTINSGNLTDV